MMVDFKSTFHSMQYDETATFILPFPQVRNLSSQRKWAGAVACVCLVPSLDICRLGGLSSFHGWLCLLLLCGPCSFPPVAAACSPAIRACCFGHIALCAFKWPMLLHGTCSQGVQCTEDPLSTLMALVTLGCHSLLFKEHTEAQGHGRSRPQRIQATLGLMRQLEANEIDTQWLRLFLCVHSVDSLGWKWTS